MKHKAADKDLATRIAKARETPLIDSVDQVPHAGSLFFDPLRAEVWVWLDKGKWVRTDPSALLRAYRLLNDLTPS